MIYNMLTLDNNKNQAFPFFFSLSFFSSSTAVHQKPAVNQYTVNTHHHNKPDR